MNMTNYLPFYSRGAAGAPFWASDPSCVFALGLNKDGPTFRSDDMYGYLCTTYGALWTPLGYSVDGVDDYINLGKPPSLAILTNSATLVCWQRPVCDSTWRWTIGMKDDWNINRFTMGISTTNVLCTQIADSALHWFDCRGKPMVANAWAHNAFVINRFTNRAISYTNGVPYSIGNDISTLGSIELIRNVSLAWTSRAGSTDFWKGSFALPKIFNRALSPLEIRTIYESEKSLFL